MAHALIDEPEEALVQLQRRSTGGAPVCVWISSEWRFYLARYFIHVDDIRPVGTILVAVSDFGQVVVRA